MQDRDLNHVIDLIYSAGVDQSLWPRAAESVQALIGAHSVSLVMEDYRAHQHSYGFSNGMSPDQTEYYRREIIAQDESSLVLSTHSVGEPILTQNLSNFSGDSFRSMFCYEAFYEDIGFDFFNCGTFYNSDRYRAWISLARAQCDPKFTAAQAEDMAVVLRHLKRAFEVSVLLADARETSELVLDALDHVAAGVVLVSRDGRVKHHNRLAEPFIRGDIWPGQGACLALPDSRAGSKLEAVLERMRTSTDSSQKSSVAVPFRSREGEPMIAVCFPMTQTEEQAEWLGAHASVMVFLLSPRRGSVIPEQWLRDLFDLTATETRVVQGMIQGASTREIADDLEVGREAIRFHLKNIYRKTDVRGQPELVALILSSLARISP